MPRRAPRTSIAPPLSPESSLSSALSFDSAHEDDEISVHVAQTMTAAAAAEGVDSETTDLRRPSQKRGFAEPLAEVPSAKRKKSAKAIVAEQETVNEKVTSPVKKRARRSRATTETATKISSNGVAQEVYRTKTKENEAIVEQEDTPKRIKRTKKIKVEVAEEEVEELATPKKSRKRTTKKDTLEVKLEAEEIGGEGEDPAKKKRRRKTKEEKEAEAMPLAVRSTGLRMFLGAHVSSAKGGLQPVLVPDRFVHVYSVRVGLKVLPGVHNSITNCVHIG